MVNARLVVKPKEEKKEEKKEEGIREAAIEFDKATKDSFKKGQRLELKNVQFNSGSAQLRRTSEIELKKLLTVMQENPQLKIEIGGHTDSVGSMELNNRLSTQRATSVRTYLVQMGINASRLVAKGYGPSQPVADNSSKEGQQKNRRVEITVN